jgi:hypothetical protein
MTRSSPKTRGARRWLVACLALAALTLAAAPAAHAAPYQFATFNIPNANQPFSFTNNGGTSGTIKATAQVTFNFTVQTGLGTADHSATLTITNSPPFPPGTPSTFTPASPLGAGMLDQPISNITTLSIIENGTGKNLLTMLFTGDITGRVGGASGDIGGSDTTGQVDVYTSDFLTFNQPGNSYDLGLNTIAPGLSIGPGSFLNNFVSNIDGQFSSNAVGVPAPASVVMYGFGMAGVGVIARWRRKRLAKVARS